MHLPVLTGSNYSLWHLEWTVVKIRVINIVTTWFTTSGRSLGHIEWALFLKCVFIIYNNDRKMHYAVSEGTVHILGDLELTLV